jgi:hypothetical protein
VEQTADDVERRALSSRSGASGVEWTADDVERRAWSPARGVDSVERQAWSAGRGALRVERTTWRPAAFHEEFFLLGLAG